MNHELSVSQSVIVNADVKKVWEALTDPTIIKDYLFGTETVTDWKVGNPVIFQGEYQGQKYKDKGVILEFNPMKTISYSYWSGFTGLDDKPENYSTVSYLVQSIDANKTQFTWTQKGFANEDGYKHSKDGMTDFLKGIKAVMER